MMHQCPEVLSGRRQAEDVNAVVTPPGLSGYPIANTRGLLRRQRVCLASGRIYGVTIQIPHLTRLPLRLWQGLPDIASLTSPLVVPGRNTANSNQLVMATTGDYDEGGSVAQKRKNNKIIADSSSAINVKFYSL
ncbi:uncharacterized protein LOC122569945 isoform X2 [Bombus pyrosoma]|nr:uncharacterized protein LOC122569945 isoform X2 [Bombus pyrosoma]